MKRLTALFLLAITNATAHAQAPLVVKIDTAETTKQLRILLQTMKSDTTVERAVAATVTSVTKQAKLVVATLHVGVAPYNYWSTATGQGIALVRSMDCKVQYYVNLAHLREKPIVIDDQGLRLRFICPNPVLDEDMFSQDPSKIESKWIKSGLGPYSDKDIENIVRGLERGSVKEDALKQASAKHNVLAVRAMAREVVGEFLRKTLSNSEVFGNVSWLPLQVVFEDEVQSDGGVTPKS